LSSTSKFNSLPASLPWHIVYLPPVLCGMSASSSRSCPPLPVCCLFKGGDAWGEVLVLAELTPGHWLSVDSDWCLSDAFSLCAAANQSPLMTCCFGDPTSAGRFKDTEASLGTEQKCQWLRTSADGIPLPGLHGRGRGKWSRDSVMCGAISAFDNEPPLPRGAGGGAIRPSVIKQLLEQAHRVTKLMMSPSEFLMEALEVWQVLVRHFQGTRSAAKILGGKREESSDEESSSGAEEGHREVQGQAQAEEREWNAKLRQLELSAVESALGKCWPLLPVEQRAEVLAEAATDIGRVLSHALEEGVATGKDVEAVRDSGFAGLLSRQCAEMSVSLAQRRFSVGLNFAEVAYRLVREFERQVGLSRPSSVSARFGGKIRIQTWAAQERMFPVPRPSCEQCQKLKQWKQAVFKLLPRLKAGSHTVQPGLLLRLPPAPQCHIASFIVCSLPHFARLAAACRRTRDLLFEAGSWQGAVMNASDFVHGGPPISPTGAVAPGRRAVRQGWGCNVPDNKLPCLNQGKVTLLKLGLKSFSRMSPVILDTEDTRDLSLGRLAQEFQICGIAYSLEFRPMELIKRLRPCLRPSSETAASLDCFAERAEVEERKSGSRACCIWAPPRPSKCEDLPDLCMVVRSLRPVKSLRLRQPVLGGWYNVQFAEVIFGFESSSSSEVLELCSLAFEQSSGGGGVPRTLFEGNGSGWRGCKLLIVGSGPSRFDWKQRARWPEPGAYLESHDGDDGAEDEGAAGGAHASAACRPLAKWNPSSIGLGDRLGLAVVELRRQQAGNKRPPLEALGLVFVHNNEAVGGRWLTDAGRGELFKDTADGCSLLLEPPLTSSGGKLACLPVGPGGGPPLQALLDVLGDPPVDGRED